MERPSLDTFGFRLRAAMRNADMGNEALAKALGMHPKSVSRWLGDRQVPDRSTIARLAEVLDTDEVWLLTGQPGEVADGRGSGKVDLVRETALSAYGLSAGDVSALDPAGRLLILLPPEIYEVAYSLLGALERAGATRDAQDAAHSFLAQLYAGIVTPGYPPTSRDEQLADAQDGAEFLRRVYERRGVLPVNQAPAEPGDPDAISGAEFVDGLASKKRKPKAG